ncbi:MAG: acetyl-CoA carboxylase, carboxyltransferase subunit beta [Candidatus Omnitrophica bacterium]|nr:acetyl-CoA carboxylase, carboxyltransferase subunit beta [Candidatus Omnitrophota bacterium]
MALFKKPLYTKVTLTKKKDIPSGLWVRCNDCGEMLYKKKLDESLKVCPKCNFHFTLTARERISLFFDEQSFTEMYADMESSDPLSFKGPKTYREKIISDQQATGLKEAAVVGTGRVNTIDIAFGVTDSRFIMGSMGSVVGEKLTRIIEHSTEKKLPLIIISGSGGGARMYEGMFSLMQMAKTSAALARQHEAGGLFLSILTNPTMAGVLASFASLGDVIIAEPKALIGFTGPRVIEQTIRQKLPSGFQTAEFLLDHGLIDLIVHRKNLKDTVSTIIRHFAA